MDWNMTTNAILKYFIFTTTTDVTYVFSTLGGEITLYLGCQFNYTILSKKSVYPSTAIKGNVEGHISNLVANTTISLPGHGMAQSMMVLSNGNIFRHKGQWRAALMFSLICAWISRWVNNREAGDLRGHCAQYDVIVSHGQFLMTYIYETESWSVKHTCLLHHHSDFIMTAMASQITGVAIVFSTVWSLAYLRGSYRGPVDFPHKGQVTRKMFLFDNVSGL